MEEDKIKSEAKSDGSDDEETVDGTNENSDTIESKESDELEKRKEDESHLTEEERENRKTEAISLKKLGNEFYLKGENVDAISKYEEALSKLPLIYEEDRGMIFANLGAAHQKMGEKETAIENCSKAIELKPNYVKALARRAHLYEETDKPHESLQDFQKVIEIEPKHIEALCAIRRLPEKVKEKDEKLKAEMFDSLKKLGNMVLNPFGLSTENFNLVQDPNTGGYSVNFNQGKS